MHYHVRKKESTSDKPKFGQSPNLSDQLGTKWNSTPRQINRKNVTTIQKPIEFSRSRIPFLPELGKKIKSD